MSDGYDSQAEALRETALRFIATVRNSLSVTSRGDDVLVSLVAMKIIRDALGIDKENESNE